MPVGDTIFMASWAPGGDVGAKLTLDPWKIAVEKWDKNSDSKLPKDEVADRAVLERYNRMDLDQDGLLDQTEWERYAEVFRRADNAVLAIKPAGRGALSRTKPSCGNTDAAHPMFHRRWFKTVSCGWSRTAAS